MSKYPTKKPIIMDKKIIYINDIEFFTAQLPITKYIFISINNISFMIDEIFKSRIGIILISIIWGLGLSTLFRKACLGRNCQVLTYNGPDPKEIRDTYYDYGNGTCYKYKPFMAQCPK